MTKKSKKKKSSSIHIITILFIAVCIAYIFRYFAFKIETEMVKYDSMENSIATQGVLIKNEWSMTLPGGTEADYKANEGDRVSIGKQILNISKNDGADENISLKIDKINERIEEIKKAEADNNFFAADKQKIDANIQNSVSELKTVTESGDFSRLEQVKSELAANVYKKSLVAGTDSFSGQNIEQLMNEKVALEEMQKNNLNVVNARISGLVSYELDGYEAVLKPENIQGLKVSSILEIINAASEKNNKKNEEIVEGVKVVDNFEWYIASVIPKGILTKDDIGKNIQVRFNDYNNTVVNGTLKHFDEGNENGNLIVVRTDEQLKDFQRIRTAKVEIITKHREGLIVPLKCIVEKEGLKGVFIERSGMARFVPIKIAISDDKEALVENLGKDDKGYDSKNYELKPYDRVITTVDKVKEDQMLPGAF
ncbi:MAG TPA: HlyD family efflux transporter periplasmic adaptor subunit [Patescibacteria group bacterium]|nr:HlyD family efflux transporter periplasmic adaptor subunit [Patescibacteria group bacterium]